MKDQSERWDRVFRQIEERGAKQDSWLETHSESLESPVLELGCGAGHDARFLVERGFSVVAADFSGEALRLTRRAAPEAEILRLDFSGGLPFPDGAFRTVVASLCLHYFSWRETVRTAAEIHRCLRPGGRLLARFNSTNDEFYKNVEKERLEDNFFLVNGVTKRLFDRENIEELFAAGWKITRAEERTTRRFGGTKTLWEVVVERV